MASGTLVCWLVLIEVFLLTASCTTMRPSPEYKREQPPLYSQYSDKNESGSKYKDPYWYRENKWKKKRKFEKETKPKQSDAKTKIDRKLVNEGLETFLKGLGKL